MTQYARGKYAFGFCDRCGQRDDLGRLKYQVVAAKLTRLRVCSACLDVDHPQLLLGRQRVIDPIALQDPRPPVEYDVGLSDTLETTPNISLDATAGDPIDV